VLDHDHRIVVFHRRDHQAFAVARIGRHDYFQPGEMGKYGFHTLRMLRPLSPAAADYQAYDQRHLVPAVADVVGFRRVVDDLFHRQQREFDAMKTDDGTLAHHGGADGDAAQAVLRHRHLDDALGVDMLADARRGAIDG